MKSRACLLSVSIGAAATPKASFHGVGNVDSPLASRPRSRERGSEESIAATLIDLVISVRAGPTPRSWYGPAYDALRAAGASPEFGIGPEPGNSRSMIVAPVSITGHSSLR
jgi:hypothetical protein